jgi:Fe-coproporphyrin III synthase
MPLPSSADLPRRLRRLRRYAGLLGPVLASNQGRLTAPWKLTVALTYVCNHKCVHCQIWKRRPKNEMSTADLEALVEANPATRWLDLTGGEPTARPDLPAILEAAGRHLPGLVVLHFPTNGTLPRKALAAAEAARDATPAKVIITVSVDGPPEVHDAIRGTPGAWESALRTFELLRAQDGVSVVLGLTITPDNAHALEATYPAAKARLGRLGRHELHVNVAQRSAHFYGNSEVTLARPEVVRDALRAVDGQLPTSAQALMERAYRGLLPRFLESGASPIVCQSLSASAFIDPWGMVYPCITEDRPLGKLQDHGWSLAELWRHTEEAAQDMREGRCVGCWTPCEAYQSLLGSLPAAAAATLRGPS